jgi:predicted GIY-YIG superfamily endonuclease
MRSTSTGEILYIGSTSNLRRRVFGNYLGGVGGATTKRLHGILFLEMKVGEVELAYEETIAYRQREAELKEAYRPTAETSSEVEQAITGQSVRS